MDFGVVEVSWRFGRGGDASLPAVADPGPWLTAAERERAAAFKVSKRRNDWLVGRLNLKALLVTLIEARYGQRCLPSHVHIARLPSGAPSVQLSADAPSLGPFQPGSPLPLSVSNSHSNGAALAAAAWIDASSISEALASSPRSQIPDPDGRAVRFAVGADLEFVEPRSEGFIGDFLTREEQAYCGGATGEMRDLRANLVWSAKEAVLKVLQLGLSADTWWLTCLPEDGVGPRAEGEAWATPPGPRPALAPRGRFPVDVTLVPEPGAWRTFAVSCDPRLGARGIAFSGRWRVLDGFAATIAVGLRAESRNER